MSTIERVREVKALAKIAFMECEGALGVGVGVGPNKAHFLIVYVQNEETSQRIPNMFEGFPVRKVITETIRTV